MNNGDIKTRKRLCAPSVSPPFHIPGYSFAKIHFWIGMSGDGVKSRMLFLEPGETWTVENMRAKVVPELRRLMRLKNNGLRPNYHYYQQDNAGAHSQGGTAHSTKGHPWVDELGLRPLFWSGNSPDLSPIEHIFSDLKRTAGVAFMKLAPHRRTRDNLIQILKDEWDNYSVDQFRKHIAMMPSRKAVVLANGGSYTGK
jgi:hypothetical protein